MATWKQQKPKTIFVNADSSNGQVLVLFANRENWLKAGKNPAMLREGGGIAAAPITTKGKPFANQGKGETKGWAV